MRMCVDEFGCNLEKRMSTSRNTIRPPIVQRNSRKSTALSTGATHAHNASKLLHKYLQRVPCLLFTMHGGKFLLSAAVSGNVCTGVFACLFCAGKCSVTVFLKKSISLMNACLCTNMVPSALSTRNSGHFPSRATSNNPSFAIYLYDLLRFVGVQYSMDQLLTWFTQWTRWLKNHLPVSNTWWLSLHQLPSYARPCLITHRCTTPVRIKNLDVDGCLTLYRILGVHKKYVTRRNRINIISIRWELFQTYVYPKPTCLAKMDPLSSV